MAYVKPKTRDSVFAEVKNKLSSAKPITRYNPSGGMEHYVSSVTGRGGKQTSKYTIKSAKVGLGPYMSFGRNKEGEAFLVTNKPGSYEDNERNTVYGRFESAAEGNKALEYSQDLETYTRTIDGCPITGRWNYLFKQDDEGNVKGSFAFNVDDLLMPKDPKKFREEARTLPLLRKEFDEKQDDETSWSEELTAHLDFCRRFKEEYEAQGTMKRCPDTPLPQPFEPYPYESIIKRFKGYLSDAEGVPILTTVQVGSRTITRATEIHEDAFFSDIGIGTRAKVVAHQGAYYNTETSGYSLWGLHFLIVGQDESTLDEVDAEDEMDPALLAAAKAAAAAREKAAAASGKADAEAAKTAALKKAAALTEEAADEGVDTTAASHEEGGASGSSPEEEEGGSAAAEEDTGLPAGLAEDAATEEAKPATEDKENKPHRKRHREEDDGSSRRRRRRTEE